MKVTFAQQTIIGKIVDLKVQWYSGKYLSDAVTQADATKKANIQYALLPADIVKVLKACNDDQALELFNNLIVVDAVKPVPTPVVVVPVVPVPVPAPVPAPTPTPVKLDTIQKGSSDPTVKYLQQKLTAYGYAVGNIDGDFGDKTDAALRDYQVTRGLKVDGVCGTDTWAAIESNKAKVEIPDNVKKEINTDVKGDYLDWKYIIIHHTAGEEKDTEQVREYHKSKGWIDIGYNFVIEKSGKIGVGRSLAIPGAHCDDDGMNKKGIGVVVIGNFDLHVIEDVEYKPLLTTVRFIMQQYNIPTSRVLGHREVLGASTACPGQYINMDALRRDLANFTDTQAVANMDAYVESNNIVYTAEGDFESGLKGIHDTLIAAAAAFIKFT